MSYIQYLIEGLKKEFTDDTVEIYYEKRDDIVLDILQSCIQAKPNERQEWHPMPLHRVKKIWNDYAKTGIVRDERGIDNIADDMITKIITLDANTELMGHSSSDPKDLWDQAGIDYSEELDNKLTDFLEDNNGQLRISDYGLDKLKKLAGDIMEESDYEKKLILIDQILNVVHQRSDLASMFIQGGRGALSQLSGVED